MAKFLHVGCGLKRKNQTTRGFAGRDWREVRLDIDPGAKPDIVSSMTDLSAVAGGSMDAVFSSHNIEHLYAHEVPVALREFARVLGPKGFLVLTCPDLQSVAALVAADHLEDPAYTSPLGPITPHDILYGYGKDMAAGNLFMAHRCGFTRKALIAQLHQAGFDHVACQRRQAPYYDLWALACAWPVTEAQMTELMAAHFPPPPKARRAGVP